MKKNRRHIGSIPIKKTLTSHGIPNFTYIKEDEKNIGVKCHEPFYIDITRFVDALGLSKIHKIGERFRCRLFMNPTSWESYVFEYVCDGESRCSKDDPYNEKYGEHLAEKRAQEKGFMRASRILEAIAEEYQEISKYKLAYMIAVSKNAFAASNSASQSIAKQLNL